VRHANLTAGVWATLKQHWKLRADLTGEAAGRLTEALLRLALVLGHSPAYQEDHAESLAQDWMHVPIPRQKKLIDEVGALGEKVATLLDPDADATRVIRGVIAQEQRALGVQSVRDGDRVAESELLVENSFYGAASGSWSERAPREDEPMRPAWGKTTGDLFINDRIFFGHVPEAVWRFELGGYPVLKKWLGYREAKRRRGNPLTSAEADHFRGMIWRVAALLALQDQLDNAYRRVVEDCFTRSELGIA
jgi:hypothetical protein